MGIEVGLLKIKGGINGGGYELSMAPDAERLFNRVSLEGATEVCKNSVDPTLN